MADIVYAYMLENSQIVDIVRRVLYERVQRRATAGGPLSPPSAEYR